MLDETHLSIGFLVDHAGYARTLGMFTKASGSFKYDEDKSLVSDVEIRIDTSSVFTNHDKRDSHLRSPDFLNIDKYPEMTFKALKVISGYLSIFKKSGLLRCESLLS